MKVAKLHQYKAPTSTHEAASMLERLELEIQEHTRTAYRLGMDVIRNRFEQGRITEQAIVINSTALNGERTNTYGQGLIDALAQKAGISPKVLRECHALYKRAGSREQFFEQLARWEDQHIKISWNLCVNWANKALPNDKDKAKRKIADRFTSLERRMLKAKDDLLDLTEQVEEWQPERMDELLGVAQAVVETIEEVQEAKTGIGGWRLEKPRAARSDAYLAFVREQFCLVCGQSGPNQAHHIEGGMATKGSDYMTVALCASCHGLIHTHGPSAILGDIDLYKSIASLLAAYIDTL